MTLYLLSFNNYYNRIIKKYDTIADYAQHAVFLGSFMNVNFNPNDGVNTQQVLNYTVEDTEHAPDYLLAVDESNQIASRWYIIEAVRNRRGQYNYTLHRDVIADYYDSVITSPVFIEKAMLPIGNPLIFNNEMMTYNQIKTNEVPIKDQTNIPWIVGYMAKPQGENPTPIEVQIKMDVDVVDYEEVSTKPPYFTDDLSPTTYQVRQGDPQYRLLFNAYAGSPYNVYQDFFYTWGQQGQEVAPLEAGSTQKRGAYLYYNGTMSNIGFSANQAAIVESSYVAPLQEGIALTTWSSFGASVSFPSTYSQSAYDTIYQRNGKIYKYQGQYYKFSIGTPVDGPSTTVLQHGWRKTDGEIGIAFDKVAGVLKLRNVFQGGEPTGTAFWVEQRVKNYVIQYEKIDPRAINVSIPVDRTSARTPYDIFCIPYGELYIDNTQSVNKKTLKEYGYRLASAIAQKGDTENIYDLQLLPYCPLPPDRFKTGSNGQLYAVPHTTRGDLVIKDGDGNYLTALFWVENPEFSMTVSAPEGIDLSMPTTAMEVKVANETNVYRLTSPNYNGTFEFSVVKNNGVQSFDIDCSYKPFSPYIKIAPSFGGIYGNDFNDTRGLILGGDFSLPQVSNEWTTYQVNNKNYQVMFDRQIENMDTNNSIQRKMEVSSMLTGTVQGGATAGIAGSMLPIPGAGLIGAGIGAGASLAGGIADLAFNEQLRSEARDYTIDQFGYNLGNIQARPANITKVSSFNPNNKIFPVIEYYTATDTEKEALRNKITYNGMTTMAIGYIQEYMLSEPTYIKGRLVRYNPVRDSEKEDFHLSTAIANELNQGVFI